MLKTTFAMCSIKEFANITHVQICTRVCANVCCIFAHAHTFAHVLKNTSERVGILNSLLMRAKLQTVVQYHINLHYILLKLIFLYFYEFMREHCVRNVLIFTQSTFHTNVHSYKFVYVFKDLFYKFV